jgi:hypothetical protein
MKNTKKLTPEIQKQIDETVDAMMVDFLAALVKVGVKQETVKKAIDLVLAELPSDDAAEG